MNNPIKKQKLLFLLHLPPPVHGSSMVGKLIMDSVSINNSFECTYVNLLVSKLVRETGKLNFQKLFRYIVIWFELLYAILKERPKLCYLALSTTGWSFYKDALLVMWLRIFSVKRVYHLHNKGISKVPKTAFNRAIYNFVLNGADIILLSEHLYDDIKDYVPRSKVFICYNGIDDICKSYQTKIQSNSKIANILFLSNLIETKGVTVLLKACKELFDKGVEFNCQFVGAIGDVTALQFEDKVKELGLEDRVKYLGKKFGDDKKEIFEKADIFAFPTYYPNECFPLVLLEAMSVGLPVVSTFEGGIPDIVENGKTGFLVPQKDVEKLAEKLELLITNEALRIEMGNAGRVKYEQSFTCETFERKLLEILQTLVS